MLKKAFSMIELVITIVVIGIVSASFPMILTQTTNSLAVAMQQEAILSTKTYIGTILSYPWDKDSVISGASGFEIVAVPGLGSETLSANPRVGHVDGPMRRRSDVGIGGAGFDDISSFDNQDKNLTVVSDNMDFILALTIKPQVAYVSDSPDGGSYDSDTINFEFQNNISAAVGSSNIKAIFVAANNTDAKAPKVNIGLWAYSSNIGETGIYGVSW